jgi:hypothetical protein
VAVQGIGAPFGIGFLASLAYFAKIRPEVEAAATAATAGPPLVVGTAP